MTFKQKYSRMMTFCFNFMDLLEWKTIRMGNLYFPFVGTDSLVELGLSHVQAEVCVIMTREVTLKTLCTTDS